MPLAFADDRVGAAVSIKLLTSIRRSVFAAATGLLFLAGSANAIIFVGGWDPAFGPSLPNLGFRGQSTFDVSAGCLTSPGSHTAGGACAITLLSASLDLYNPNQGGTPTLQTLIYAPGIFPNPTMSVFVAANLIDIIGVGMSIIGPRFDTTAATGYDNGPLWLQFILNSETGASNAFIYRGTCPIESPCAPILTDPSMPASIRVSRIPEPGSLALLFIALAAGALTRRLRKL